MSNDFKILLQLLANAALGTEPDGVIHADMQELYNLAIRHQVHTILFPLIDTLSKQRKLDIDSKLLKAWELSYISSLVSSTQRQFYVNGFIEKLQSNGIDYCILKGVALSHLYHTPESRISGDVDILINDPDQFKQALDLLSKDGFTVKKTLTKSHQTECYHKKYGLIELHSDVCDRAAKEIWFENKLFFNEPYILSDDGSGNSFKTLSITDGAIFTAFHFIKHFLSHGSGCRQLLDMLLYLKRHHHSIDWNTFNSLFADLRYLKFIDTCKQIGNLYMGLDFKIEGQPDIKLCEDILSDIETSGVFGNNESFRKYFTYLFTSQRKSGSFKHQYISFYLQIVRTADFIKRNRFNLCKMIFALRSRKKEKSSSKNAKQTNARLSLFTKLGFFDKS